jgi:hypothetical protein
MTKVAKKEESSVASFAAEIEADAGKGFENVGMKDKVVPFIQIAQGLSPQIDESDASYIPGLKVGDIFNSANNRIYSGKTGIKFVPCAYKLKYNEWVPREKGGGFVGERGPEVESEWIEEERDGRFGRWLRNGNTIVVTGVWYGLLLEDDSDPFPAVISYTSTQLKKSKKLMSLLDDRRVSIPGVNGGKAFKPAMFATILHLTTVAESNEKGKWAGWRTEIAGSTISDGEPTDLYYLGRDINAMATKDQLKIAEPQPEKIDDQIPF